MYPFRTWTHTCSFTYIHTCYKDTHTHIHHIHALYKQMNVYTHTYTHILAHILMHMLVFTVYITSSLFVALAFVHCLCNHHSSWIFDQQSQYIHIYIFSITGNRGGLAVRVPECLLQGKVPKAGLWSYFCKNHLIPIFIYQPEDLAIYRVLSVQVAWISFPQGTVLQIIELQTPRRHTQRHRFP